jgi:hypothetical protein
MPATCYARRPQQPREGRAGAPITTCSIGSRRHKHCFCTTLGPHILQVTRDLPQNIQSWTVIALSYSASASNIAQHPLLFPLFSSAPRVGNPKVPLDASFFSWLAAIGYLRAATDVWNSRRHRTVVAEKPIRVCYWRKETRNLLARGVGFNCGTPGYHAAGCLEKAPIPFSGRLPNLPSISKAPLKGQRYFLRTPFATDQISR